MSDEYKEVRRNDSFTKKEYIDNFLQANLKLVEEEVKKRILESNPKLPDESTEEDTVNALRAEIEFAKLVIDAYYAWSKEDTPVVLWDVDDTMGKHVFFDGGYSWRFRPVIFPLLEYLQSHFPNIRNGILSNRPDLKKQLLNSNSPLAPLSKFIDQDHLFSSRGKEVVYRNN